MWGGAETLSVALWPWAPGTARHVEAHTDHMPKVQARVMWDDDYLALMFRVEDRYVRAVAGHPWNGSDSVCTDSCVEFFVAPVAGSDGYLNCEANCGGTMLLGAHGGILGENPPVEPDDRATIPMVPHPPTHPHRTPRSCAVSSPPYPRCRAGGRENSSPFSLAT